MSRKVPPSGPRALLRDWSTLPPTAPAAHSSSKRLPSAVPTGPRSLTNGIQSQRTRLPTWPAEQPTKIHDAPARLTARAAISIPMSANQNSASRPPSPRPPSASPPPPPETPPPPPPSPPVSVIKPDIPSQSLPAVRSSSVKISITSPVAGPSSVNPSVSVFQRTAQNPSEHKHPSTPSWPPPRASLPSQKSYKVIYDPAMEKQLKNMSFTEASRREDYYTTLMDFIRVRCTASVAQDRIKGKGKGKEILYRYEGEIMENGNWVTQNLEHMQTRQGPVDAPEDQVMHVIDGVRWLREKKVVPKDPRKRGESSTKPHRTEFHLVNWQHDENSIGPPPPTAVLVTNISPLTPNTQIRRHFSLYGPLVSFEPQIDKENGGALGIVYIKFQTHEQAKLCAEKENGRKGPIGMGSHSEGDEIRVVLDGEGLKLKAVLKELDERKKRDREEKKRRESTHLNGDSQASKTPATTTSQTSTPAPPTILPKLPQGLPPRPQFHPLPQNPSLASSPSLPSRSSELAAVPMQGRVRRPPPSLVKSRYDTWKAVPMRQSDRRNLSSTPVRSRSEQRPKSRNGPSPDVSRSPSRSPSRARQSLEMDHAEVLKLLGSNGKDHIKIDSDAHFLAQVREDDVKRFFEGFKVDKVLKSRVGLFVTFETDDSARRATLVLANRQLGYHDVTLSLNSPPPSAATQVQKSWGEQELVDEAQAIIIKELRALLERDVKERVVGSDLRKVIAHSKVRGISAQENGVVEQRPLEKKGLMGLSFKKKTPRVVEEVKIQSVPQDDEDEEVAAEIRPKKKRKKEISDKARQAAGDDEIESEDEVSSTQITQKRDLIVGEEEEEKQPRRKKLKLETKQKTPVKKKGKKDVEAAVDAFIPEQSAFDAPEVTLVRVSPGPGSESSISRSRSPSPKHPIISPVLPTPSPRPPTPPPPTIGICDDDEDYYLAKLALSQEDPDAAPANQQESEADTSLPSPTRKHVTGSARTEGFYKITHAEKAAYVTQYQSRSTNIAVRDPTDDAQPQHVTSSRSNRANARRRAQGLEEINQVQRAVALSKGEMANELTFKFNQLQTRKKHLRFAKSPIHDWGLYAMERIARGEMVIEYVGEIIRAQVADKREKNYERQGIGSSYLFRIDEDLVVDATKKGNLGRLINHSCDPNCTAKIITINGEKKIVIYAKQDIELGDEITYDYHFPLEQDKIPCLCGSAKCRGYLN